MNYSGDAAEQIVRFSLEGMEAALKITGSAAKEMAILLIAALKTEQKTAGKTRLTSMLKSGKELTVFSLPQKDLKKFVQEAKKVPGVSRSSKESLSGQDLNGEKTQKAEAKAISDASGKAKGRKPSVREQLQRAQEKQKKLNITKRKEPKKRDFTEKEAAPRAAGKER